MWRWAFDACCGTIQDNPDVKLIVSTDDKAILARVETGYGRLRDAGISGPKSPIHEALQDAVKASGEKPEWVGFIPANVPTVTFETIQRCMPLKKCPASAVITTRRVHDHPAWMWRNTAGWLAPAFPSTQKIAYRMQELVWPVIATGSVNLVRREVLMACSSAAAFRWLGDKIHGVDDPDAVEVHDEADLERARLVIGGRHD